MTSFTPIIKQLMVDGITNSRVIPKLNPKGIFLLWFAAVWAVLGSAFLLCAGYLSLQERYANDLAALIMAAVAMGLSMLIAFAGLQMMKRHRKFHHRQTDNQKDDMIHMVNQLIDTIGEELEEPIRENPKTAMMVATLAGFFAGNHAH